MLKRVFLGINIILIVLTLLSYASPYISPNSFALASLLGLAFPYLFLLNVGFILFWLIAKWRYSLFSVAVLFLGLPTMLKYYGTSTTTPVKGQEKEYKIVSFNMQSSRYAYMGKRQTKEERTTNLVDFMQKIKHIDVFCGQEVSRQSGQIIERAYNLLYKHKIKDRATAIYSRYPIINAGQVNFGTRTNSCLWADVKFPKEVIRVYSIHLRSNQISEDAEKVLEEGDFQSKSTWKSIGGIFKKYASYSKVRADQAQKIMEHKKKSPHKSIICGDLNDTPQSFVYNFLAKDMKDSFIEKGSGLGTSYAGAIPGLRIDYILVDKGIEIYNHTIMKEKYSDHYPIMAQLGIQ